MHHRNPRFATLGSSDAETLGARGLSNQVEDTLPARFQFRVWRDGNAPPGAAPEYTEASSVGVEVPIPTMAASVWPEDGDETLVALVVDSRVKL